MSRHAEQTQGPNATVTKVTAAWPIDMSVTVYWLSHKKHPKVLQFLNARISCFSLLFGECPQGCWMEIRHVTVKACQILRLISGNSHYLSSAVVVHTKSDWNRFRPDPFCSLSSSSLHILSYLIVVQSFLRDSIVLSVQTLYSSLEEEKKQQKTDTPIPFACSSLIGR